MNPETEMDRLPLRIHAELPRVDEHELRAQHRRYTREQNLKTSRNIIAILVLSLGLWALIWLLMLFVFLGSVSAQGAGAAPRFCQPGYAKSIRPSVMATQAIKHAMLRGLGIPLSRSKDYELDHIVPLELDGAPLDESNLQLQSWTGPWNAHDKDELENEMHRRVCRAVNPMSLPAARQALSANWCVSYVWAFGRPPESAIGEDERPLPVECQR